MKKKWRFTGKNWWRFFFFFFSHQVFRQNDEVFRQVEGKLKLVEGQVNMVEGQVNMDQNILYTPAWPSFSSISRHHFRKWLVCSLFTKALCVCADFCGTKTCFRSFHIICMTIKIEFIIWSIYRITKCIYCRMLEHGRRKTTTPKDLLKTKANSF